MTTQPQTWHLDEAVLTAWAEGRLNPAAESAVETHLTGCGRCQQLARTPAEVNDLVMSQVTARIRARDGWAVRTVKRLGVSSEDLVLLGGTSGLVVPWSIGVGGAIFSALVSAWTPAYSDTVFWLLAPLVPMLAVVAAFDATDPLRELSEVTPYPKLRLALLRTLACLLVSLPTMLAVGLATPVLAGLGWVWLLPSLGLTSAALALLTRLDSRSTATTVAVAWSVVVLVAQERHRLDGLSTAPAQLAFALIAVGLIAILPKQWLSPDGARR